MNPFKRRLGDLDLQKPDPIAGFVGSTLGYEKISFCNRTCNHPVIPHENITIYLLM